MPEERKHRALTSSEVHRILNDIDHLDVLRISVLTCLFAGLRIAEVSQLTFGDFQFCCDSGLFRVRKDIAKYGHQRNIPACSILGQASHHFLAENPGRRGKIWKVSLRTVQRRFAAYFKQLSIDCTPHDLRHSFACACYLQSRDLSLVQHLLGHVKLSTTMVYVHLDGILQNEISKAILMYKELPSRTTY